ncbi:hypothetical protein AB1N83_010113 [Pleurotus pulmonarius]
MTASQCRIVLLSPFFVYSITWTRRLLHDYELELKSLLRIYTEERVRMAGVMKRVVARDSFLVPNSAHPKTRTRF